MKYIHTHKCAEEKREQKKKIVEKENCSIEQNSNGCIQLLWEGRGACVLFSLTKQEKNKIQIMSKKITKNTKQPEKHTILLKQQQKHSLNN